MQIRIREGAHRSHRGSFANSLRQIEGRLVEVDTEYLFKDQFNTVPIPGVTDNGLRVFIGDVEGIIDDARLGMGKCTYCARHAPTENTNMFRCDVCPFCGHIGLNPFVRGSRREQGIEVGVQSVLTRCFPRR